MDRMKVKAEFNQGKFLFKIGKYEETKEYLRNVPKNYSEYEQVEYMLKEMEKNKKGKK